VIVVTGPKVNRDALVEQAYAEHPEEASTSGVLFVPEDILGDDEETRTATLLAIHRQASRSAAILRRRREEDPLAQMRREAWRQAGL
jgi:hypothetical protein